MVVAGMPRTVSHDGPDHIVSIQTTPFAIGRKTAGTLATELKDQGMAFAAF
jgi:hypothetical protein